MLSWPTSNRSLLRRAKNAIGQIAPLLDLGFNVELWDGSRTPLGTRDAGDFAIKIHSPGVISSMLRRMTLNNLIEHFIAGRVELKGGDLTAIGDALRERPSRAALKKASKWSLFRQVWPFLLCRSDRSTVAHAVADKETGFRPAQRNRADFVQFHYDVSNEFYQLFLDESMMYTCAYFVGPDVSLEQAQRDKMDMICRKLRLRPGDRLLDAGCGWGALLCHAVQHYGVTGLGVTLSKNQHAYAQENIRRLGIQDRAAVELRDIADVEGEFDKIASIGIIEHIGIANYPAHYRKLWSLLRDRGMLLNHGISKPAKPTGKAFRKLRPEYRIVQKYVFPGGELGHIGNMVETLEACRFDVHDVEGWRAHYARTTRLWCQRLHANRAKAVELVGEEKYRAWAAYLAGFSFAFEDGHVRIFQTVATKQARKGFSGMPLTRAHLFADKPEAARKAG